jgi:hypothetical protein
MPTIQDRLAANKPFQKLYAHTVVIGMPLLAMLLLVLPADFFDDGPPMCLSVLVAGIECYGCGMTRGIMHLIHFDFHTAWDYNPLAFLVFPLAGFLIAIEWWKRLQIIRNKAY